MIKGIVTLMNWIKWNQENALMRKKVKAKY